MKRAQTNKRKKNVKRWTAEQDQQLIRLVAGSPNNFKYAFERAGEEIEGRSAVAAMNRYYAITAKKDSVAVMALAGNTGVRVLNRKNSPIPRKAKTAEMRMEVVFSAIDKMSVAQKKDLVHYILEL